MDRGIPLRCVFATDPWFLEGKIYFLEKDFVMCDDQDFAWNLDFTPSIGSVGQDIMLTYVQIHNDLHSDDNRIVCDAVNRFWKITCKHSSRFFKFELVDHNRDTQSYEYTDITESEFFNILSGVGVFI